MKKIGIFSWERPIEDEILHFVSHMRKSFEKRVAGCEPPSLFGFFDIDKSIREGAQHYADAYRTVEKHILKEIMLRKKLELKDKTV